MQSCGKGPILERTVEGENNPSTKQNENICNEKTK